MSEDAEFLHKEPCHKCGSKDNLARYSDGHGYCFGCHYYEPGEGNEMSADTTPSNTTKPVGIVDAGSPASWDSRSINEASSKKWGFTRTDFGGEPVRIFNYRNANQQIVAQKLRFKGKDFKFLGDTKNAGLYGMHLWRDGGRRVVVTEGEIDAISVSQAQGHKWPVVSVPNGAQGARKALQKNLEWLNGFEEVVLMFDMDEPGQEAAKECMTLFEPGKCKIASLPLKDANAMIMEGQSKELIDAIWGAKVLRPDGIVSGSDMFDLLNEVDDTQSMALPFVALNEMTMGIRKGELMTLTAGSGVGKSAVVREFEYHLIQMGETVGMLMLEEPVKRTGLGLMSIAASKPLHLDRSLVSDEEFRAAYDATLGTGRVYLYDHFGSTEIENMLAKVRYLARGCDCGVIFVDHLSIIVSGQEGGDERRMIDKAMTDLKTLAVECNVAIVLVSHLKRPAGDKGHENGAETSLAQLRGSHAIAQLSDFVIGLERDQQNTTPVTVNGRTFPVNAITTLRVLKNRWTGETGPAGWLAYDRETGRLSETRDDPLKNIESEHNEHIHQTYDDDNF